MLVRVFHIHIVPSLDAETSIVSTLPTIVNISVIPSLCQWIVHRLTYSTLGSKLLFGFGINIGFICHPYIYPECSEAAAYNVFTPLHQQILSIGKLVFIRVNNFGGIRFP